MRREIRPGRAALRRLAMACALAALVSWGIPEGLAQAGPQEKGGGDLATVDHHVAHISTMPANPGEAVELFVRERYAGRRPIGKPVVMVHGRSVPAVAGFALQHERYDWASYLAKAGFDVFVADLQGSGRSPRPKMDDPCNATNFSPDFQQRHLLVANPLAGECAPSFPFRLVSSKSEWDQLNAVVDYVRDLRGVDKVAIVSWSRGSLVAGPYAVQHPEKVESLFLLAPIFNPNALPGTGADGFAPPFKLVNGRVVACTRAEVIQGTCAPAAPPETRLLLPATAVNPVMSLIPQHSVTDADGKVLIPSFRAPWDAEIQCDGQVEDGMQDVAWNAIMENDDLGRTWGPPAPDGSGPDGVMRVRSFIPWGWVPTAAARLSMPVLIIFGELDTEGTADGFPVVKNSPVLYDTIPHEHKLLFQVACAGHRMLWEGQAKVLHHISKQWLKHGAVEGFDNGKFYVDAEGNLYPM